MKRKVIEAGSNNEEKIGHLVDTIKKQGATLSSKKVTAGFDGFVDTIVNIIKSKPANKSPVFFNTKNSFGNYILEKQGTSFSLELEEKSIKLGGNMPIMANALGRMGIQVNCIGALGYPQIHPVFKELNANCNLQSFTDPGMSTAVEFRDGKIILGEMGKLNSSGWQTIKERIGINKLVGLYKKSDLLCIVNWAEIDASGEIWRGILTDVFSKYKVSSEKQPAFFDLSDCSKRSSNSIREVLGLLKEFSQYTRVVLGLNRNEARLIYRVLYKQTSDKELAYLAQSIFDKLSIDTLLLHSSREAVAFNKAGLFCSNTFFIKDPKISTGAGDNFNAGFCAGLLMQLDTESSLIFANAVAALYMATGTSPQLPGIINFLTTKP